MITTDQLRSDVFDRLTGRLAPKFVHPTAKAFDFSDWRAILTDDSIDHVQRDFDLVSAAKYIGANLKSLRDHYVIGLFDELSADQIVELALADANRGWNIFRWKLHEQLDQTNKDEIKFIGSLAREGIPVGPNGAFIDSDDANNAIIDGLPYWFAEAVDAEAKGKKLDPEATMLILQRGHMATNLMQVFKSVWQEVLWEPWSFTYDAQGAELAPRLPDELARWRAWDWREQAMIGQVSLLNRNLEKDIHDLDLVISSTAVDIGPDGIVVGAPDSDAAKTHRSAFDNLEKSYVFPFLNEPISGRQDITPKLLETVVCILQDLLDLHLPRSIDPAELDEDDPLRFACVFRREHLLALVHNALGLVPELAAACIENLTSDPFGKLGELFTIGLWHRPLVRSQDGENLMIAAGALMWGSPVRRVERWLQNGAGEDLSDTAAGHRFEAALRLAIEEAVSENPILGDATKVISSISHGEADEEIDFLLRIGGTVLVGEVKCLLGPSEPIERHNYIGKLEAACSQAARKANWLQGNPEELIARLGDDANDCRIQPLVVVNQSNGMEWEYEGCPITDARFLELFLSDGKYIFGGKMFSEPNEPPELFTRTMYSTAAELEAAIPEIFLSSPVMDAFRDSIMWASNDLPLPGGVLRLAVPRQDPAAYEVAMQKLLTEAQSE